MTDYTAPLVSGPGRCTECGWHTATQGHRTGCTAPSRSPAQPTAAKTVPPTKSIQTARMAALRQPTRRAQIAAYRQTGPLPAFPMTEDFIGNVKTFDAAIALILQGAPPQLFDWTDPPTPETLRRNNPARVRAVWDAVTPPQKRR